MTIRLCEMFVSKQGEGPTTGTVSLFVRLSGCNLECVWCDTPYTWYFRGRDFGDDRRFSFARYDPMKEIKRYPTLESFREAVVEAAGDVRHIVLTGGEPMLQWKNVMNALWPLREEGFTFEVETNGTVEIQPEFGLFVDRINCSPKLWMSGNRKRVFYPRALRSIMMHSGYCFKIVTMGDASTARKIVEFVEAMEIPPDKVYIMPEGTTPESQQMPKIGRLVRFCERHGFVLSLRQHILDYGNVRGV